MQSLGQVSYALTQMSRVLEVPYNDEFFEKYHNLVMNLPEQRYKKLLAMCFNKQVSELLKLTEEWRIVERASSNNNE